MKIRNGFVSNSSSTAFILDRRKLDAVTIRKIESLPEMDLLNRCTGSCSDAQNYLDDRVTAIGYWYENGWDDWNSLVAEYIGKLGNENVILCRESDEGMSGEFEDVGLSYDQIEKLAEAEWDYH